MKKCLSVLLTLAMCMILCIPTAAQEATATDTLFEYDVLEDGTARITEYQNTFDDAYTVVTVPSKIDGYTVSTIGRSAFLRAFYAHIVILPDGITKIETAAFQESGVQTVFLPSSLQTIEERAFYWCTSLKKLVIPSSVTVIGQEAIGYSVYPDPDDPELIPGISDVIPDFTVYADNNPAVLDYAEQNGVSLIELSSLPDGDADLSGECNTADVRTILQYCMNNVVYWQAGDFNYDGEMNTVDARECLRYVLRGDYEEVSPCPEPLILSYDVDYIEVAQGTVFVGDTDYPLTLTSEED